MINDHKTQGEWKIKLKMLFFSFFSSKDSEETRTMFSPSENTEVIIVIETDKIIEYLFYFFYKDIRKVQKNQ